MWHHCRSFCWFNNFQGEELRVLMRTHYLRNYLGREFSRAERGRLRSHFFLLGYSLRFHSLNRIQKPPKVHFWLKAKCETFNMNLMMTPSQKGKMLLLRILRVIIPLEILTMKRKVFLFEIHWCVRACFPPFIALNINTASSLSSPASGVFRRSEKCLILKRRQLNYVTKMCLLPCAVTAIFLGKSIFFFYAHFVISRL